MIKRRIDGTYEIELNGLPYHVTKEDPLFSETDAWAQGHPGEFIDNDPAIAPQPVDERPFDEQIKAKRNYLINTVTWRVERYNSETRLGVTPTDDITALDTYIQALRDIPEQEGFPWNGPDDPDCPWPTLEE